MLNIRKEYDIMITYGDLHIPLNDVEKCNILLQIIEDIQPDIIVDGGDLINATCISTYDKSLDQMAGLEQELIDAQEWLRKVNKAAPKATKVLLKDNHLFKRLYNKMKKEQWLSDLSAIMPENLLKLNQLGWTAENSWKWKNALMLTHGDDGFGSSVSPVNTVRKISASSGLSIVRFHSHNYGSEIHNRNGKLAYAIQLGTLHDKDKVDYIKHPELSNWSPVIGVFYLSKKDNDFHFIPLVFVDNKVVFNNKIYTSKRGK